MLIIFSGKIRLLKSKYFSFSESEEGMRIGGSENDSKNTQQDGRKNIGVDKGRFGSYLKLCDFTLLSMTLQVELRLNKRIISETQTS